MKERIGICEGCEKPLYDGDMGHACADGPYLCEACSPTVADCLRQYEQFKADGDVPENFDTLADLDDAIEALRADNPACKLVHQL